MRKVCNRCKIEKCITDFGRSSYSATGINPSCKICIAKYQKRWSGDGKRKEYARQYYLKNKARILKYNAAHKKKQDPDKFRVVSRKDKEEQILNRTGTRRYKEWNWKKIGIIDFTWEDFDRMNKEQGGLCYLCGKPSCKGRSLCVDHNHKTGKVRKLLCFDCNTSIGKLGDSTDCFIKILNYIKEYE